MPTPPSTEPLAVSRVVDPWVEIRVKIPRTWKLWLEEAAQARALSVAALVRQCIRGLMISRHEQENRGDHA